jgi:hypothetical protein
MCRPFWTALFFMLAAEYIAAKASQLLVEAGQIPSDAPATILGNLEAL